MTRIGTAIVAGLVFQSLWHRFRHFAGSIALARVGGAFLTTCRNRSDGDSFNPGKKKDERWARTD
jgi:hypothetical protein